MTASMTTFLERLDDECVELMAAITARGMRARLLGGMAIRLLLGDRLDPAFRRPIRDIDVVCDRKAARELEELLAARGWAPEQSFNALNGARRLLFRDPASDAQVDVFVGAFEMCHALPLADRLDCPPPTLPATDLLATKLQIVELNEKDRGDLYALLLGCEVADGDHRALEPSVLGALTGRDWGMHHTFELNLARLRAAAGDIDVGDAQRQTIVDRIARLEAAMEATPKSRGWKLRARIGERRRWYDDPEEVDRAADDG